MSNTITVVLDKDEAAIVLVAVEEFIGEESLSVDQRDAVISLAEKFIAAIAARDKE